ncbi:porin family protein [Maribacter sp. 2-571]|uniref:porin family protein n=1 Tax=Maribacter sp. 2-571 TaxID=3417569 RepID=UPI003D346D8A
MKLQKRVLVFAVTLLTGFAAMSQAGSGFGIKAGFNYNQNGDLIAGVGDAAEDIIQGSDGKVGYQIGVFYKRKLAKIYLRPELIYTKTASSYELNGATNTYDISKLDLPVLLGVKVVGPLHVFAGPAFQYLLENDLENFSINEAENDFTVGLHLGAGVNLGKLGFDVRYERGFSQNEANFVSDNITPEINGRVDSRPSQVILAVSLKL